MKITSCVKFVALANQSDLLQVQEALQALKLKGSGPKLSSLRTTLLYSRLDIPQSMVLLKTIRGNKHPFILPKTWYQSTTNFF